MKFDTKLNRLILIGTVIIPLVTGIVYAANRDAQITENTEDIVGIHDKLDAHGEDIVAIKETQARMEGKQDIIIDLLKQQKE